jgi:hydroxymethylbilane synthase
LSLLVVESALWYINSFYFLIQQFFPTFVQIQKSMNPIRIGTRNSPLALWQALEVEKKLQELGHSTQVFPVVSHGDKNLKQPLYQMNVVGVFTKDLDVALLNDEIDVAVHSLKDIPTQLPENIELSAVLARDFEQDILIRNPQKKEQKGQFDRLFIGTGSLRRRAFWKAAFSDVRFENIRGNVQTRLQKLESENFDGTIFSLAGIKRLNLPLEYETLDFIIPAPAQGVVGITSLKSNEKINKIFSQINHQETEICTRIERDFLKELEGGCTAPIGAIAKINGETINFKAGIVSIDGMEKVFLEEKTPLADHLNAGKIWAEKAKKSGAGEIIEKIRKIFGNR